MAWEVYGGKAVPESGLGGVFCLRDSVTKLCKRDELGHLQTFPDAVTAQAAIPVAVKQDKAAEVIAEAEAITTSVKAVPVKGGK